MVLGFTQVAQNLGEPGRLDELIAAACAATLWGVVLAHASWLPSGRRLERTSAAEVRRMRRVAEGVLGIEVGDEPPTGEDGDDGASLNAGQAAAATEQRETRAA